MEIDLPIGSSRIVSGHAHVNTTAMQILSYTEMIQGDMNSFLVAVRAFIDKKSIIAKHNIFIYTPSLQF